MHPHQLLQKLNLPNSEIVLESQVLKDVSYVNPELGIEIQNIFG